MRFLIGADVDPNPDSGAAGTVYHTNQALVSIGCEVDEIWKKDLGRRLEHGNLHYLLELPRSYRREVTKRCARTKYDAIMLSQPHAYLAGRYVQQHMPETVFLNRSHGWEGHVDRIMESLAIEIKLASAPRRGARHVMKSLLERHQTEVLKWSDGMVVGSSPVAEFIHEHHKYPRERIAVLPHGIPAEYIDAPQAARDHLRWRKILYVGQFTPIKAPEKVADVMNDVLSESVDAEAGWVCDSAHHGLVRDLLAPSIRARVTLYPWMNQHDLIALYDAYGIFIFPSYYEGFGKAPFEAMARGLALIASRVGGMADLIEPGENGMLAGPGDGREIARITRHLLKQPDLARHLGNRARETAQKLRWENTAQGLRTFTEKLVRMKRDGKRVHG